MSCTGGLGRPVQALLLRETEYWAGRPAGLSPAEMGRRLLPYPRPAASPRRYSKTSICPAYSAQSSGVPS